jgi:hypothetical protein
MLAHMAMEQTLLRAGDATTAIEGHPAYGTGSQERMRATDEYLARRAGLDYDPNDRQGPDWSQAKEPGRGAQVPQASPEVAAQIEREAAYIAAALNAENLHFANRAEGFAEIRRRVFAFFRMGTLSANGPIQLGDGSGGGE